MPLRGGVPALSDTSKRAPLGLALAGGSGVLIGLLWAFSAPWLVGLGKTPGVVRAELFACGLGVGLVAALAVPRGAFGAGGALRLGLGLGVAGLLGAGAGVALWARALAAAPAVALGLCALGLTHVVALGASLVGFALERRRPGGGGPGGGAPLRTLVAAACGALAAAAWTITAGHVLGQRHADTFGHAAGEARDVVALAAERLLLSSPDAIEALLPRIAPKGGFLVTLDESGRVEGGVGLPPGEVVGVAPGLPPVCRAAAHALPCALRRLGPERRVVAAVPPRPLGAEEVLAFVLIGLIVAGGAVALGRLVGAGAARDLDRVAGALDDLRRSAKGLARSFDLDERTIVVASLDEVGDLAAALGRLRAHLAPRIATYRVALEKAQAADHARDEFLAHVSVALRSPLNQVIAAASALLDIAGDPLTSEQRDDVKTILSASRHLVELIDEVLDVSAIATGQVKLRLGEVDVTALVSSVAKTQRPLVQKKGLALRLALEPQPVRIVADEKRLRQVLTNIVSNAVKFTEQGHVEIAVESRGSQVHIRVTDTGPGIAAEQLPRLFREFVQLGSLKQRAHGTGLGLAICKRLVQAHDGEVSAESDLGKGATFVVTLPAAGPHKKPTAIDDTPVEGLEGLRP